MTTAPNSFWNDPARVDMLTTAWKAGHSAREIAAALAAQSGLPVTRNMVVSKAHRLGLPMHQDAHGWRGMSHDRRRG